MRRKSLLVCTENLPLPGAKLHFIGFQVVRSKYEVWSLHTWSRTRLHREAGPSGSRWSEPFLSQGWKAHLLAALCWPSSPHHSTEPAVPRAGITRNCSSVVPDKRWSAQLASSLLAFLLHLLILQLQRPKLQRAYSSFYPEEGSGRERQRVSGKEWNQPVSRFQMRTLIQQQSHRNTFPTSACRKRLKAHAPESSRQPGIPKRPLTSYVAGQVT